MCIILAGFRQFFWLLLKIEDRYLIYMYSSTVMHPQPPKSTISFLFPCLQLSSDSDDELKATRVWGFFLHFIIFFKLSRGDFTTSLLLIAYSTRFKLLMHNYILATSKKTSTSNSKTLHNSSHFFLISLCVSTLLPLLSLARVISHSQSLVNCFYRLCHN